MSEHDFALNTLNLWGQDDTRLRLGIVSAFYELSEGIKNAEDLNIMLV